MRGWLDRFVSFVARTITRGLYRSVEVVGFDDLPFAQHLNPSLTTVRAPIEQAGYLAATELFTILATGEADVTTVLPVELVIRQSCGCLPPSRST